jgi:hypothetical protein
MNIRKVKNGYIFTDKFGSEEIHTTLESVFSKLLLIFEGRSKLFKGDSFGAVEIHRKI